MDERESGRLPVNVFEFTSRYVKEVKRDSTLGIGPVSWFSPMLSQTRLLRAENCCGIWDETLFRPRLSNWSAVSRDTVLGIGPVIEFVRALKLVRPVR